MDLYGTPTIFQRKWSTTDGLSISTVIDWRMTQIFVSPACWLTGSHQLLVPLKDIPVTPKFPSFPRWGPPRYQKLHDLNKRLGWNQGGSPQLVLTVALVMKAMFKIRLRTVTGWWFQRFVFFHNIYMGCHPSHWRTHIFQDGSCTTNQCFKNKIMTRESQEIDGRCRSSIRMLRLFKTCLAYKGGSAYMIHVAAIRIHIHTYAYTYEQPSKLALWKICIRWTLVVIKCKKLRLAMGPFQIAIPPFEMFHLRPTVLGSGLVAQSTVVAMCFKYNLFWAPSFGCLKN